MNLRKVYIRHREGYPETEMQDSAMRGFRSLGVEIAKYDWIDDIDSMNDLGPEVGVCSYVGDVHRALAKMGRPIPDPVDYPDELWKYLGRDVRQTDLDAVTRMQGPVFVKPVKHKLFSGFVWRKDIASRARIATVDEKEPVWVSSWVNMESEHRVCVLRGEIVGAFRYSGAWWMAPDERLVREAVARLGSKTAAYCLDFAVTPAGTVLVEMNEGFAFGHYGLKHEVYAEMLAARWFEMAGG